LGDRNQFETLGAGSEVQARQFLFGVPPFELHRAPVYPGFAFW
jgi:hypothetical protein